MPAEGVLPQLFLSEPAGRFALGHVFSGNKGFVERPEPTKVLAIGAATLPMTTG
jgi:hypothetical protein